MINYSEYKGGIALYNQESFIPEEIFECGQCFRFSKTETGYKIIAMGRVLHVDELKRYGTGGDFWLYPASVKEFEEIWINYFDLKTNYERIKEIISLNDGVMREAVGYAPGIRLLNQDKTECLISFIISQNNNIPRIKKIIDRISKEYGEDLGGDYSFPKNLEKAAAEDYIRLGAGFRARYIADAVLKISSGEIDLEEIGKFDDEALKNTLMEIKGVGSKVSGCVMLFSYNRRGIFPIDVWVRRVMRHFYFQGSEASDAEIAAKARSLFGEYGGYAQQYLFHYARRFNIK